jgi:hypothetical protein
LARISAKSVLEPLAVYPAATILPAEVPAAGEANTSSTPTASAALSTPEARRP